MVHPLQRKRHRKFFRSGKKADPKKRLRKCFYCDRKLTSGKFGNKTLDHANPKALGGEETKEEHGIKGGNLIACCRTCNEAKGCIPYYDWMTFLGYVRRGDLIRIDSNREMSQLWNRGFRLGPDGSFYLKKEGK